MNEILFEKFLQDSSLKLKDRSDSEKVRLYIEWCIENNVEALVLRLSSETKGGWSKNYSLDFTTTRVIISKKPFVTKFADLGYVAGLAPYPYMLLMKNMDKAKIRKQASKTPEEILLLLSEAENSSRSSSYFIWYADVDKIIFRKGIETMIANMFGRAVVSNFLTIRTVKKESYDFVLPVNKNGIYEQIRLWLGVAVPPNCISPE